MSGPIPAIQSLDTDAEADVVSVPVGVLAGFCNPFEAVCWHGDLDRPITMDEVAEAVVAVALCAPAEEEHLPATQTARATHVARIAWFVVHGWNDPVSIDVGVPALGHHTGWMVDDGNHRLAAALFRGDTSISAEISGQLSYAVELGLMPGTEPSQTP